MWFSKPFYLPIIHFKKRCSNMTAFRFEIKSYGRGKAAGRVRYALTPKTPDGSDILSVGHFNLPTFSGNDPVEYFQQSDLHERKNGAAARQMTIWLPAELPDNDNVRLAERLAKALAGQRPSLYAVHKTRGSISGTDHPHVHIVSGDRALDGVEREAKLHFSRASASDPGRGGAKKLSGGQTPGEMASDLRQKRELASDLINEALTTCGLPNRVDPRSMKERGITKKWEQPLQQSQIRKLTQEQKLEIQRRRQSTGAKQKV